MNIKALIKYYVELSGNSQTTIIDKINYKLNTNDTIQNLNKKLKNETIRYDEVKNIADAAGYKIDWIDTEHFDKSKIIEVLVNELKDYKYVDVERIVKSLGYKIEWNSEKNSK